MKDVILEFIEVVPDPHNDTIRYAFNAPDHEGFKCDPIVVFVKVVPAPERKPGYADIVHRKAYIMAFDRYLAWMRQVDQMIKEEREAWRKSSTPCGPREPRIMTASDVNMRHTAACISRYISQILNGREQDKELWASIASLANKSAERCTVKDPNQAELPL